MQGKLITLEGLDGAGKGTHTQLLLEKLGAQGRRIRKVSFPRYEKESSALVRLYLSGAFGQKPGDVNAYAASTFFAVDRFASYKEDWKEFYENGGVVLADRYTTSNAIHQCSKLPRAEWDGFLNWLFDLEYTRMGLPAPDGVFFLDMTPAVSQQLMTQRYHGQENKKDIHEKDLEYLNKSREAALYCVQKLGWTAITLDDGQKPYSIEENNAKILLEVEKALER